MGNNSRYYKATVTGELQDAQRTLDNELVITANTTMTIAQSGGKYNVGTDALVIELPAIDAGNLGMEFTFTNTGANGAVLLTLSPSTLDAIVGTVGAVSSGGVVNKNFVNTKATAKNGDWITLKAKAANKWFIEGGIGVWTSEA